MNKTIECVIKILIREDGNIEYVLNKKEMANKEIYYIKGAIDMLKELQQELEKIEKKEEKECQCTNLEDCEGCPEYDTCDILDHLPVDRKDLEGKES